MLPPIYRWIEKADGVVLWKRERCVASISARLVVIMVPRGPDLDLPCSSVDDGRAIAARWWSDFDLPPGQRPVYPWEQAKRAKWAVRRPPPLRLPRWRTPEPLKPRSVAEDLQPYDSEPTTIGGFEQDSP